MAYMAKRYRCGERADGWGGSVCVLNVVSGGIGIVKCGMYRGFFCVFVCGVGERQERH